MPRATVNGTELYHEIAARFGGRMGLDVAVVPGTHAAYHDRPRELVDVLRPLLREVEHGA